MKRTILNNVGAIYNKFYKSAANRINQVISDGLNQGLSQHDIKQQVTDLVNGVLTSQANSVATTSTNAMANNAKVDEYKEQGIEMVEWVLADDHDIEDECDDYDGQQWPIDEAVQPPLHYNCKCTLSPIINEE